MTQVDGARFSVGEPTSAAVGEEGTARVPCALWRADAVCARESVTTVGEDWGLESVDEPHEESKRERIENVPMEAGAAEMGVAASSRGWVWETGDSPSWLMMCSDVSRPIQLS